MRTWIWGLIAALALTVTADAAPKKPTTIRSTVKKLSLADCLSQAMLRNPLIKAAQFGVQISKAKLFQANWGRFPKLQLKTALAPLPSQEGNALTGNTNYNKWGIFSYTELEGYMPLFTFGKIRNLQKAARYGVKVDQARTEMIRQEVRYLIRKAYWAWQLTTEVSEIVNKGVKRLNKEKKRLQKKLDKNDPDVDQNDLLRIRIAEVEIVSRQMKARRLNVLSMTGLKLSMGLRLDDSLALKKKYIDPLKVELKPLKHYFALGLKSRPDLIAVAAGVKARRHLWLQKKSHYYPDLILGGFVKYAYSNVATNQPSPFASDPYNTFAGGIFLGLRLSLDYPLKVGEVRQARGEWKKLLTQRDALVSKAKFEIQKAYLEARDECKLLKLRTKASRSARAILSDESRSYDEGFAKLSALLKAVTVYYTKDLERLQGIYACNLALANLSKVVGHDLLGGN